MQRRRVACSWGCVKLFLHFAAEANRLQLQKEVSRLGEETRQLEERRAADLQAALKGLDHDKKDLQKKLQDREAKILGEEGRVWEWNM